MKNAVVLFLRALLMAACLFAAAWPASAYIKAPPPPQLGAMCELSSHIYVLRVEKFSAEKGVILFKPVDQLKAKGVVVPDGTLAKLVIGPKAEGVKGLLDWAGEGKRAVLFAVIRSSAGHLYIDGSWYRVRLDQKNNCWFAVTGEPHMLTGYCGTADKLGDAVTKILRGEEVVVPAKLGEKSGRAVLRELRARLPVADKDPKRKDDGDKKPNGRKPDLVGIVQALADDGKSFTLVPPVNKNKELTAIDVRITDVTTITTGTETGQLAVGQTVSVWLKTGDAKVAATVQISKPR